MAGVERFDTGHGLASQERQLNREHLTMQTGIIKKWLDDRGYGFLKADDGGPDIFLHRSQLLGAGIDPYSLSEGDALSFDIGLDRDQRPTAINVRRAQS